MSVEIVRKYFANVKFWFLSWKKDKALDLVTRIKETIESIKAIIASMFDANCNVDDRIVIASVNAEVREIEATIGA